MKTKTKKLAIAASTGWMLLASSLTASAQNVSIAATPTPPDQSAGLEVNFTDRGLLIPRVALTSSTDANTIQSPAHSLLVYNTGTGGLTPAGYYYNAGTTTAPKWVRLLITGNTPSDAWLTLGNVGTTPGTHFIGTTDNVDLVFKTNNTEQMRILTNGNVGIGTTTPNEKLDIAGNVRFSGALMPAGNAGSSGQVLMSQGPGIAPAWTSISSIPGMWRLVYVDSWDAANNTTQGWSGAAVTNCNGVYMLGGYGQCGQGCTLSKTFSSLPPHTEVMVKVYYWKVDTWDQNSTGIDYVVLKLNGTAITGGIPAQVIPNLTTDFNSDLSLCGVTTFVDQGPFTLVGKKTHSASSILVEIVSGLDQSSTDESLGVVAVEVWCK